MDEWRETRLGEIGTVVGGGTPSRERTIYWGGDIPWLTPGELTGSSDKYVSRTQECISNLGLSASGARLLPKGSLLITSRASIGSCALAGRPLATNQGFKNLIPGEDVDPDFLFYLGQTLSQEMTRRASGTTFLEISAREFERIVVCLPQLEEQRRIAEILDTVDDTIRATEQLIHKITVAMDAIQNQLMLSAHNGNARLDSVSVLGGGNGFPETEQGCRSGSLPFYKVSDMSSTGNEEYLSTANNYVDSATAERYGWRVFPPGAVVFPKVGAALLSNRRRILSVDSIIDNNMMAVVPLDNVSTEWLYFWLQTVDLTEFVQVGALPSVNQSLVGGLLVWLPSCEEQQRQVQLLRAWTTRLNAEVAQLKKYESVRVGLADDLLSGRVRTVTA